MKKLTILFLLLFTPSLGFSATYYVDPVNGLDTNNGSSASPWKSLQKLFDDEVIEKRTWNALPYTSTSYLVTKNPGAMVKGGDFIYLRSGNHGELNITSYYNSSNITVAAEQGHRPVFRNIMVRSSRNWVLQGLYVDSSSYPVDSFSSLMSLESHSWTGPIDQITVAECDLRSISNSSKWSKTDWNSKAKSGIRVDGKKMKILNNKLLNVNFGISVGAEDSLVDGNTIENFAGDGLRGLGNYTVFQNNIVKNCYNVNDNHDDGFQSWSVGKDKNVGTGVVKGIVLRGNTIINFEDPGQPFRGTLQGIGCFDGMFEDWVVEKNVVQVDHWHGISLYGAINSVIKDNIVTDPNGKENIGPPWVMLNTHKNGTPPTGNVVTCNISPRYVIENKSQNIFEYNTNSETGSPRHSSCPTLHNISTFILPMILRDDEKQLSK